VFLNELRNRDDIEIVKIPDGSLVREHLVGRSVVIKDYFSFLFDYDDYLSLGIDERLRLMLEDPTLDVVVTNGYARKDGLDLLLYSRLRKVASSPLNELFQENWLHNCNHLFRSSSVSIDFFENHHEFMEWTWLGFNMAVRGLKIGILDVPTFRYNDTPNSLSKNPKFAISRIDLYRRMLKMRIPIEVSGVIRERLSSAWHDISEIELRNGNRTKALSAHVRSLLSHWKGMRFLSYTRHFIKT